MLMLMLMHRSFDSSGGLNEAWKLFKPPQRISLPHYSKVLMLLCNGCQWANIEQLCTLVPTHKKNLADITNTKHHIGVTFKPPTKTTHEHYPLHHCTSTITHKHTASLADQGHAHTISMLTNTH